MLSTSSFVVVVVSRRRRMRMILGMMFDCEWYVESIHVAI